MDREISKEEQRKEQRKKIYKIAAGVAVVAAGLFGITAIFQDSVSEKEFIIRPAETGTLESTISASGKIVPLYELAVVSPVSTKILEVYANEGDVVNLGEPLLKLDLQDTETELQRLSPDGVLFLPPQSVRRPEV